MSTAHPDPLGPWDAGLQPERTALSWQRTGLAVVVASLVAFRVGLIDDSFAVVALALVAFVAGVVVLRASRTELGDRVSALREGRPLPAPVATRAAAVAVLALAASVLLTVLR